MPRGDKNQIMSYRIPAIDDVVKVFSSEASKVLNLISTNRREIATLEQLRDALLPKLMSGEIDASKVEQFRDLIAHETLATSFEVREGAELAVEVAKA